MPEEKDDLKNKNEYIIEIKVYEPILGYELPVFLPQELFRHSREGSVVPPGYHKLRIIETRAVVEGVMEMLNSVRAMKVIGLHQVSF